MENTRNCAGPPPPEWPAFLAAPVSVVGNGASSGPRAVPSVGGSDVKRC